MLASASSSLVLLLWIASLARGAEIRLTSQQLYQGLLDGQFQALVDVRSQTEWDQGHIENATLLVDLNQFGASDTAASPNDIIGCKSCSVAVYCRSGSRASAAIRILEDNGFTGSLYNGLGTSQWLNAGFPLSLAPSVDPPCKTRGTCDCSVGEPCVEEAPVDALSNVPSSMPSATPTAPALPTITIQPVPQRKEEQPSPFRCRGIGRGDAGTGGESGRVSRAGDNCVRRLLRGD